MFVGQVPVGQIPVEQMFVGQVPVGQIPVEQMFVGQTFFDQKTLNLFRSYLKIKKLQV